MKHERIFLNDNERSYMDTYIADSKAIRPAILVIAGGGYGVVCDDREGEPIALDFFAKGYNAFVLNYRVGREGDVFPKQLLDAAAAMIYIRTHAEEFKIDPLRVFAVGFSAGGHLCGSIATMYDYPEVKEAFGEDYIKVRPTGAILSYPVTVMDGATHVGSFKNLLGRPSGVFTEEEMNRYSLDRIVNKDSSPMFVWHTVEDKVVPVEGSLRMAMALNAAGVPYRLSIFPYGPHGIGLATELTECGKPEHIQPLAAEWTKQADEWMRTLPDSEL